MMARSIIKAGASFLPLLLLLLAATAASARADRRLLAGPCPFNRHCAACIGTVCTVCDTASMLINGNCVPVLCQLLVPLCSACQGATCLWCDYGWPDGKFPADNGQCNGPPDPLQPGARPSPAGPPPGQNAPPTGPVGPVPIISTQGEYVITCPLDRVYCGVCKENATTRKVRCAECFDEVNYVLNKATGMCRQKYCSEDKRDNGDSGRFWDCTKCEPGKPRCSKDGCDRTFGGSLSSEVDPQTGVCRMTTCKALAYCTRCSGKPLKCDKCWTNNEKYKANPQGQCEPVACKQRQPNCKACDPQAPDACLRSGCAPLGFDPASGTCKTCKELDPYCKANGCAPGSSGCTTCEDGYRLPQAGPNVIRKCTAAKCLENNSKCSRCNQAAPDICTGCLKGYGRPPSSEPWTKCISLCVPKVQGCIRCKGGNPNVCEACDLKKYIQKALAAGVVSVRWFHFNRQRCTLKPCKDIYGANCAKCGPRQCTECIKQPIRPVLKLPCCQAQCPPVTGR